MKDMILQLIINAKDNASKVFGTIGGRLNKFRNRLNQSKFALGLVAGAVGFLAKQFISAADNMEQWTISFETMLGSAGEAKKLMQEVTDFAARTPFELPSVIKGTKGLLAFGVESSKIIPTLKMLGDVSAGLGVPMERLILNFGQVKAQAKLTGRELRDFAVAGVPLLGELAKNLNKTEAEIGDMVSRGKIGFAEVEAAFAGMAGEGGRFENLMERQMTTVTGVFSNVKDQAFQVAAAIGKRMLPAAKEAGKALVDGMGEALEWVKKNSAEIGIFVNGLVYFGKTVGEVIKFAIQQFKGFVEYVTNGGNVIKLVFTGKIKEAFIAFKNMVVDAVVSTKDNFLDMVTSVGAAHDQMLQKNIDVINQSLEKTIEAEDKKVEIKKEALNEISEAEIELRDKLAELKLEEEEYKLLQLEEELEKYRQTVADKTLIEQYGSEARKAIAEDEFKKKKDLADKELKKRMDVAKHIKNATENFAKDAVALAVKVAQNALDNKKKEYDNAVLMGTMTQEEADKLYEKDKKSFKRVQKAEAVVSGALGISRAYSSAMVLPPPANIIVGAAQAALMAGITALQISQINAAEHGAIVSGDQLVRAGEKGKKELFMPLEDARAKAMLGGLFGGGGITINELNVTNEIAGMVGADNIDEMLERITEATENGVTSALKMAQAIYNEGKEREELS